MKLSSKDEKLVTVPGETDPLELPSEISVARC